MEMKEFGVHNEKIIVLIHGACASWEMWEAQIKALETDYHVIVPVLNGHNLDSKSDFVSPEQEAMEIFDFFDRRSIKKVFLLGGASLGGMLVVEILSLRNDFAEYAFIESTPTIPYNKLGIAWIVWLGKIAMKMTVSDSPIIRKWMDRRYHDSKMMELAKRIISNMSTSSLSNLLRIAYAYELKDSAKSIKAKSLVVCGEKEAKVFRKSAVLISETIPSARLVCIKNFAHGELSIASPDRYIGLLRELIS
ncbi:alpha/beta fold hydrolase [Vallitalea okinawensis]|uniref:alpha/beta fold hydrolase n=1 Tax=Vallitalea okinawensis TaxID=2078660 RepID=UPI000CFD6BFF|nr:alpha/beta hydrolase [Vallitalea okinawensis]